MTAKTSPTVVIVGAGVIGLSVAYHLTRLGIRDVTVIDRADAASGSSGRSVGVIETQYLTPLDVELRALSAHAFNALERDHKLHITRNGYLRLGHTDADADAFQRSVELQRTHAINDARVLTPRDVAVRFPDLYVGDISAALYGPSDGFLDGHRYCALLAKLAQAGGAKLLAHTPLLDHAVTAASAHTLHTPHGPLHCDLVVNAAGAWAQSVGALLGVNTPISPQRHEVCAIHLPRPLDYLMPEVMDYSPNSGTYGLYFRHHTHGQLLGGLHSEELISDTADPDNYFEGTNPALLTVLSELLPHRLPTLANARLGHGWAGLYPVSLDGLPLVGPCPEDPTILAACGLGGYGIQVSPIVGQLVAEWIAHGNPVSTSCAEQLLPGRRSTAAPAAAHRDKWTP